MVDFENIYSCNITELLTNNHRKINEHDQDFQHVLKSLEQISASEMGPATNLKPDKTGKEINADVSKIELERTSRRQEYHMNNNSSSGHESQEHCVKRKGKYKEVFPQKLFKLLKQSESSGYSHVISWLPHGRAFRIHDENLFEQHYLLNKESKLESFKRQLYVYGFRKIKKGNTDSGSYFHDQFIRGQEDLCHRLMPWKKAESRFIREVPNFEAVPVNL